MKKFAYLCGMLLLSINMTAQIDPHDRNWDTVFIEDFSEVRAWNDYWWCDRNIDTVSLWRCFSNASWPDGVTTSVKKHRQAYQPGNAVFSSDSTMKLIGEFKSQIPLRCGCDIGYCPAPWRTGHSCNSVDSLQHPSVHYYSGTIETIQPVGFGYYEIECTMPTHDGACSAFWFWSCIGGTYNEIDVFEHSTSLCHDDMERGTLSGIWYNPDSTNYIIDTATGYKAHRLDPAFYSLPSSSLNLENYHRFGCLWMPERVSFFVDGIEVNESTDASHVPQYPMFLKITHLEDLDANFGTDDDPDWWQGTDEMTINYVKAYKLMTDCESDEYIRSLIDFSDFNFGVKHSISMGDPSGTLAIPNSTSITLRATESITIDGGFEVPVGTEMTLIIQECPEWQVPDATLLENEIVKTSASHEYYFNQPH